MEFRNLEVKDYPQFLKLYNSAFPENQRRIFENEEHVANFIRMKGGKFHGFAYDDGNDDFVGFLTYWTFKGYVYIEHFAVKPERRGKRIGTAMLSHLFKTVSEDVLIEVEMPESEESRRRIAFYEKQGFRQRGDVKYIQPPYSATQQPQELMLMTHGNVKLKDMDDIREMLQEVYNVNHGE